MNAAPSQFNLRPPVISGARRFVLLALALWSLGRAPEDHVEAPRRPATAVEVPQNPPVIDEQVPPVTPPALTPEVDPPRPHAARVTVPPQGFVGVPTPIVTESRTLAIRLTVSDAEGRVLFTNNAKEDTFVPYAPGVYKVTAVAVNKAGVESLPSETVTFVVTEIPKAIAEPPPATAVPLESLVRQAPAPLKPNEKFRDDLVSVEALLWRMQSSQQFYRGRQRPTSAGVGLRGLRWWGADGLEGILRTNLFGLNDAGGKSEVTDLEIRYHRRLFLHSPFSASRDMQLTIYAGLERFRNARSDLFSNGYDLLRVGLTGAVPVGAHWSGAGELGVGIDAHASRKFEAQYLVLYYFDKKWSLGLGYRFTLFEARTASQAPRGEYPYREGYTEMRSVLNYQF